MADEEHRRLREEYRPSRLRLFAGRTHEAAERAEGRLDRLGDAVVLVCAGVAMLLVAAVGGSIWLPLTGSWLDLLLWSGICVGVTLGLALLVRARRRARFGDRPSSAIKTRFEALALMVYGWLGSGFLAAFALDASSGELGGSGIFFGLSGASLLGLGALQVSRYVMKE